MVKKYYLRKYPDPVLRKVCEEVTDFSDLEDLLKAMKKIMHYKRGWGLSAPQVGDTRRVVIVSKFPLRIKEYINPKIISAWGYIPSLEGCLSLPEERFKLRKLHVKVEYQDRNGNKHTNRYTGLSAAILQHEIDHLDGKLMID